MGLVRKLFRFIRHPELVSGSLFKNHTSFKLAIKRKTYYPSFIARIKGIVPFFFKRKTSMLPILLGGIFIASLGIIVIRNHIKGASAAWFSANWTYRKEITIDADQVPGSSDLTNFPVLVSLSSDSDLSSHAQANGDDIMFTDAGGTQLSHEIESYSSGTLVAWVKVPTVSATADTLIYMYYGNSGVSSQEDIEGVWDSNYQMVQHLNETSGQHIDSTANSNDSTTVSVTSQGNASAKIGGADGFDGNNDYIEVPHDASLDITGAMTISGWLYDNNANYNHADTVILCKGVFSWQYVPYCSLIAWNTIYLEVSNDWTDDNVSYNLTEGPYSSQQWIYYTFTRDSSNNVSIYINGQLEEGPTAIQSAVGNTDDLTIGADTNISQDFNGRLDEIRMSNTNRSTDWITTEYNNQNSPATFYTLGTEEVYTPDSDSASPVGYWKFDEGQGSTAYDSMGSHNGTITGSTWTQKDQCVSGNCLQFSETGNIVTISNTSSIDLNSGLSGGFTINGWIKPTTVDDSVEGSLTAPTVLANGSNNTTPSNSITTSSFSPTVGKKLLVFVYAEHGNHSAGFNWSISASAGGTPSVASTTGSYPWAGLTAYNAQARLYELSVASGGSRTFTFDANSSSGSQYLYSYVILQVDDEAYAQSVVANGATVGSGGNGSNSGTGSLVLGSSPVSGNQVIAIAAKSNDATGALSVPSGYTSLVNQTQTFTSAGAFYRDDTTNATVSFTDLGQNVGQWAGFVIELERPVVSSDYIQLFNKGSNTYLQLTDDDADGTADIEASLDLATTDATVTVSEVVTLNKWHYVSMVYDGSQTIRIYVDGKYKSASSNGAGVPGSDSSDLTIGGDVFSGFIDEFKLYDFAQTAAEVKADYISRGTAKGVAARFGEDDLSRMLTDGLVGYWKMDEVGVSGSNWTATDSSGNSNSGTGSGNASVGTTAPGKFGNGGYFDGNNDYLTVPDASNINITGELTVAGWFYDNNANYNHDITPILCKSDNNGMDEPYCIKIVYREIVFQVRSGWNQETVSYDLDNNGYASQKWQHFTITRDSSNKVRIYINGELKAGPTSIQAAVGNSTSLFIGSESGSDYDFNGKLDEIRIYNRVLDPAEVKALYEFAPGPIGYWKMDERSGTTAIDSSGFQNNLYNASASWILGKFGSAFHGTNSNRLCSGSGSCSDDDELDMNLNSFTVAFWYKCQSNPSGQVFLLAKQTGSNAGYAVRMQSNGKIGFAIHDGGTFPDDTTGNISAQNSTCNNQWHHVAGVADRGAGNLKLYSDGILIDTDSSLGATGSLSNSLEFVIGDRNTSTDGNEFFGDIDDVRVYNYARTPSQVIEDMNAGHPIGGSPIGSELMYWKMDEGYGDFAYDDGTADNDGYLAGGDTCPGDSECPTWTNDGKFGKALSFDGGDYMEAGTHPGLDNNGTGEYSASLWFKTTTNPTNNYGLMGIVSSGGNQDRFLQVTSAGLPRFYVYDGTERYATGSTVVTDGKWHYLAGVFDGSRIYIYVDGKLEGSTSTTGTEDQTDPYVRFSHAAIVSYYDMVVGSIDEAKIFNIALTAEQIKIDYNRGEAQVMGTGSTGLGGTSPDSSAGRAYCVPGDSSTCNVPVLDWRMNEGSSTTVYDVSGNGNNGSFGSGTSAPTWTTGYNRKGIKFDGTQDVVYIPDGAFSGGLSTGSVSFWLKPETTGTLRGVLALGQQDTNGLKLYLENDGRLNAQLQSSNGSSSFLSTGTLPNGAWSQGAITWNGSTVTYYINGRFDSSTSSTFVQNSGITNRRIGTPSNRTYQLKGIIDEVKIYNYARTSAQIAWEYNQGSPIAYYPLNECSGSTVYNHSKDSNDKYISMDGTINLGSGGTTSAGTCTTSGAWADGATGKIGASMYFDNNDDYITAPDNNIVNFPEGYDFSIGAWVKIPSLSDNNVIVAKKLGNSAGQTGYMMYVNSSGQIATYISDGTDQINKFTSRTITAGKWYYITMVYRDDTSLTMYINGQDAGGSLVGTIANVDDISTSNSFAIGGESDGGLPMSGQIDEVKVFNYALNTTQMKTEMTGGAVRFE